MIRLFSRTEDCNGIPRGAWLKPCPRWPQGFPMATPLPHGQPPRTGETHRGLKAAGHGESGTLECLNGALGVPDWE